MYHAGTEIGKKHKCEIHTIMNTFVPKKRMIWMDSTELILSQERYRSIYGEHTAIIWLILKWQYQLKGSKYFQVMSNQKAMSNIYSLTGSRQFTDFLEELRNLNEITMMYNFWVVFLILSHYPKSPKKSKLQFNTFYLLPLEHL